MTSHYEKGPGHFSISKASLPCVLKSTFVDEREKLERNMMPLSLALRLFRAHLSRNRLCLEKVCNACHEKELKKIRKIPRA